MFDLMNEMSELIYVVDLDTYELLFMNRKGKETFGLDNLDGRKCYSAIHGYDAPCEFCSNTRLDENEFYTWECTNRRVGRHYVLKDKFIDWNGKKAKIEIAFDMTENEEKRTALENALASENLVTECARRLYAADDDGTALNDVLRMVGEFLESDRTYIFEFHEDKMSNTYEWCADHAESQKDRLQDLPASVIDRWMPLFRNQQNIVIEDLERIREENPEEYEALKPHGIRSLITAPMVLEDHLEGYIAADNYRTGKLQNVSALLNSIGFFIASVLRHKRTTELLEHLSYRDPLTGALNRNAFMRDIEQINSHPYGSAGVISVDINGMKQLNDQSGHKEGDAVLVDMVNNIKTLFPKDSYYRLGGDEFAILCQGMEEERFRALAQDLRNIYALGEHHYTVSMGICWKVGFDDIQKLIFEADERMYADKKDFYYGKALSGRYRHHIDDVLGMTKPGALKRLVKEKRLVVYFQPKISVWTHRCIGAEALVRCRLMDGSVLSPDQFVPVLEEARLIDILDFHVFASVCVQMQEWREAGLELCPVSVNFSRYSLSVPDFAQRLWDLWSRYQVPMDYIEIEVTETVEADDNYNFLQVINKIKEKGFKVSIDDFGVKNANLSLFTSIRFDVLKVDKSLICDLPNNERAMAILGAISDICHKMHIKLIAEGVETQEQLRALKELGCDEVQGYLFSRPIPVDGFERTYLRKT